MSSLPPDKITVTVNEAPHEVFMSYGLLTELARHVPSLDMIPAIVADHTARDAFIGSLLAKRSPSGRLIEAVEFDSVSVSLDDIETLMDWSQEHLLNFFLRRAQKAQAQNAMIEKALGVSSSAGTQA
jgi:hypothetical protein